MAIPLPDPRPLTRPPRKKGAGPREHSRYDQALFAAKNGGKLVRFTMAQETSFTDDECDVSGHISQVDKFDIEIVIPDEMGTIWLKKSAIMATKVLR